MSMKTAKVLGVLLPLSVMASSMSAQDEIGKVHNLSVAPGLIGRREGYYRSQQMFELQMDNVQRGPSWIVGKSKNHSTLPAEFQWDEAPVPESIAYPVYPFAALQASAKGKTHLKFVVGPDGEVVQAQVVQATTPEMGQAVLAMIDDWSFKPAKKQDGTPAFAVLGIEYEFNPSGSGDVPVSKSARNILDLLRKNPDEIVPSTQLDMMPKPISRHSPVYPVTMHQAGLTGSAMISFFIDEKGDAQLPDIVSSSAPEFGYAAAQAVATWRFEPPKKAGKTVITRVQIPVEFNEASAPLASAR